MIYGVYVIRDVKMGFTAPMLDTNDDVAIRGFATQVKDAKVNPTLFYNKSDYSLYKLGTYDTETAHYDLFEVPQILLDAVAVKEDKE